VNADKTAAVGVEEADLGVFAGLINPVNLETSRAQRGDDMSEWRAH
jgi:hypothetical protein